MSENLRLQLEFTMTDHLIRVIIIMYWVAVTANDYEITYYVLSGTLNTAHSLTYILFSQLSKCNFF